MTAQPIASDAKFAVSRANKIYIGIIVGMFLGWALFDTVLPSVHGGYARPIVAYLYASCRVLVFPAIYLWLVLDANKSLPWRRHPVTRFGVATALLSCAFVYLRWVHPIDTRASEMVFWGALISCSMILGHLLDPFMRRICGGA